MKAIAKINRDCQKSETYLCLLAARNYDLAQLYRQCSKPSSLKEAEGTANLINLFIEEENKKVTPYQFMKSENEQIDKAIDEYNNYKNWLILLRDKKQLIEDFAKWYTHSSDVAFYKSFTNFIIYIGEEVLLKKRGDITEKEFNEHLQKLAQNETLFLKFYPGMTKKAFIKFNKKVIEIKNKIMLRTDITNCKSTGVVKHDIGVQTGTKKDCEIVVPF